MTVAAYIWIQEVTHPDGTMTESVVRYEWTGTGTAYTLAYQGVVHTYAAGETDSGVARNGLAAVNNAHSAYSFTGNVADEVISSADLAFLRAAIDRGYGGLTLSQAIASLGNIKLLSSPAAAFLTGSLPTTLDESMLVSNNLTIRDVLTVANPFVNTTATNAAGSPFALPTGTTNDQAIVNQWSVSTIPVILQAIQNATTSTASPTVSLHTTPYADAIQKVYVAFFNRPADTAGFNYYDTLIQANGGDVGAATSYFGASPEYLNTYAGLSSSARVDAIYMNLFGRHAEIGGRDYWAGQLDGGHLTINNVAMAVLSGAQSTDATIITNRVTVAGSFTAHLDNQTKLDLYNGSAASATARTWLSTVTGDASTVTVAVAKVDAVLKGAGISGSVTSSNGINAFALDDIQRVTSILTFKPGDGVTAPDTITGFHFDKIDVSDFRFTNSLLGVVVKTGMSAPQTTASGGFFVGKGVAIGDVGADTYVYVDTNKNGGFDPGVDSVIKIVGAHAVAADIVF